MKQLLKLWWPCEVEWPWNSWVVLVRDFFSLMEIRKLWCMVGMWPEPIWNCQDMSIKNKQENDDQVMVLPLSEWVWKRAIMEIRLHGGWSLCFEIGAPLLAFSHRIKWHVCFLSHILILRKCKHRHSLSPGRKLQQWMQSTTDEAQQQQ